MVTLGGILFILTTTSGGEYVRTCRKEKSLPCVKGGGTACRDGGIVED